MCLDTRQIITGFLIFLGSAPIFYYSKRQNTVEISIYGSEIFAMRILIEHLLVIHYKLRMVCMEVENVLLNWGIKMQWWWTLGCHQLHSRKKYNLVAFHKVREDVAAGFVQTGHIDSNQNAWDILTKSLSPIDFCRNMSGHTKMGRPAARLETMVFEDKLVCSGIVVCKRWWLPL